MRTTPTLRGQDFASGRPLHPLLSAVRDRLHPQHGSIWFRSCAAFQGDNGQQFARTAANFFSVPVVGHTCNIHVWQSGAFALEPGEEPSWPSNLGRRDRGRHKGELQWSAPLRRRTVGLFQFHPPLRGIDCWLPGRLISSIRRLFNRATARGHPRIRRAKRWAPQLRFSDGDNQTIPARGKRPSRSGA